MASKTITLTSTPQLLARGAGHRGSRRNVSVQVKGAAGIVTGDADSQDYTVASGVIEDFAKGAGDNLWAKSTGADTEVELSFDIKTISDVEEVLRSGAPAGQHKARWYSTRNPVNTSQAIYEKYRPGSGSLQMGSTTGADTNDPLRLTHSGGQHYAWLPGVADNYLSIPDDPTIDFTGDLEIVARVNLADWTPAAQGTILSKGVSAWEFTIVGGSAGTLRLRVDSTNHDSTIAPTHSDGVWYWVKVTHRKSDGRIQFFTAADADTEPSSWTQVGTDVSGPTGATSTSTSAARIGQRGGVSDSYLAGCVSQVIARGAIDGADVVDVNLPVDIDTQDGAAPDAGQSSFTCTTGQTVTVNYGASGLTTSVVTEPLRGWDGVDDYGQAANVDTPTTTRDAGKYTGIVVFRKHTAAAAGAYANERLLSFESASANGCYILLNSSDILSVEVGNGTAVSQSIGSYTASTKAAAAIVINDGNLKGYDNTNGMTSGTSIAGLTSDPVFAVGRVGCRADTVSNTYEGEFFGFLPLPGVALTEPELDILVAHLLAGNF